VGQNTTTYSYDPASNLATVTYPNGLQSSFTYDDLNRITALNVGKASYNYTLDQTGNRKQVTESSGRVVNWSYDGIYRLTNETISLDPHSINGSVGYGLDPVSNRLSQTSTLPGIATGSFNYDPDDRLSTETYDANGNTLTSGGKTFAYDFENRLKSLNSGAVTIQYDGDGNRVAKTVNGVTTRYLVDSLNPTGWAQVVEEVVGTTAQRTYTYGRKRITENQPIGGSWTASFYGYDGLGSVRLLTDATGAVTDTYGYDAWGNVITASGSTPNEYFYRGEQYDSDLNLYYFRARHFDPLNGRFVSRDTHWGNRSDPITLHKYLYADGDPVDKSDPTGHGSMQDYAKLVGSLILAAAPAIERAGVLVRGQMALGAEAIEDSAYWWELLERYAPGSGQYRTVASASVLKLADGAIREASAISSNRWPSGLVDAIEDSGDIVIRIPWDKALAGAQHAEQILLAWAKANNYLVLAIASGGRDICAKYCETVLETASEAQNAEYGVPIFYVYGGYY
jgi:RHS repeat-associated protein